MHGQGFPKSLDIGKAIDKRGGNNEQFNVVRDWLRKKVKEKGLSYKDIDTSLGNPNSHKASHYLDNSQPQIPTHSDWEILKKLLCVETDIERPTRFIEFEREIIGYRKVQKGVAFTSEGPTELPITKPATEEAKLYADYGTNLKPSYEPIILIKKPNEGTYAETVLKYGTGALNIGGCRVAWDASEVAEDDGIRVDLDKSSCHTGYDRPNATMFRTGKHNNRSGPFSARGRWPTNVLFSHLPECKVVGVKKVKAPKHINPSDGDSKFCHSVVMERPDRANYDLTDGDGNETISDYECAEGCPVKQLNDQVGIKKSGFMKQSQKRSQNGGYHGGFPQDRIGDRDTYGDEGFVSRFFYCAKPSPFERNIGIIGKGEKVNDGRQTPIDNPFQRGETERLNIHPTVKSIELCRWLIRLLKTPKRGIVLDPFMGSGSTGMAAILEDMDFIGMDNVKEYKEIADQRIEFVRQNKDIILKDGLKPEIVKKVKIGEPDDPLKGVFG